MIQYTYNNNIYTVDENSSISSCLTREDLLSLPLVEWDKLLKQKSGTSEPYILHQILLAKIEYFDKSDEVNSFIYKGKKQWLDKNTRMGLMNLANCYSGNINLVLDGETITIDCSTFISFLKALEVYAYKCYYATQLHLVAAKELRSKEDIINYDYTAGYPDKIVLE